MAWDWEGPGLNLGFITSFIHLDKLLNFLSLGFFMCKMEIYFFTIMVAGKSIK
jgi:hypothetical protein